MARFLAFRVAVLLQKLEVFAFIRPLILRVAGIKMGRGSSVGSGVSFISNQIVIGAHVRIGAGSRIDNFAPIIIDDWVRLGPEVLLETASHRVTETGPYRRTANDEYLKSITIERGSMIYARALILPGVVIGEGCVIGAGSVIDRNTEPYGLYVGCRPKKPIKRYLPDER